MFGDTALAGKCVTAIRNSGGGEEKKKKKKRSEERLTVLLNPSEGCPRRCEASGTVLWRSSTQTHRLPFPAGGGVYKCQ